jgi:hypothetical protein
MTVVNGRRIGLGLTPVARRLRTEAWTALKAGRGIERGGSKHDGGATSADGQGSTGPDHGRHDRAGSTFATLLSEKETSPNY